MSHGWDVTRVYCCLIREEHPPATGMLGPRVCTLTLERSNLTILKTKDQHQLSRALSQAQVPHHVSQLQERASYLICRHGLPQLSQPRRGGMCQYNEMEIVVDDLPTLTQVEHWILVFQHPLTLPCCMTMLSLCSAPLFHQPSLEEGIPL